MCYYSNARSVKMKNQLEQIEQIRIEFRLVSEELRKLKKEIVEVLESLNT